MATSFIINIKSELDFDFERLYMYWFYYYLKWTLLVLVAHLNISLFQNQCRTCTKWPIIVTAPSRVDIWEYVETLWIMLYETIRIQKWVSSFLPVCTELWNNQIKNLIWFYAVAALLCETFVSLFMVQTVNFLVI